jgi:hypothetical protein
MASQLSASAPVALAQLDGHLKYVKLDGSGMEQEQTSTAKLIASQAVSPEAAAALYYGALRQRYFLYLKTSFVLTCDMLQAQYRWCWCMYSKYLLACTVSASICWLGFCA